MTFSLLFTLSIMATMGDALADGSSAIEASLPPLQAWHGASEALVMPQDDPWVTPAELTDLADSPSYDDTVKWLRRLVAAAPQLKMVSIGTSPEGRALWLVVASKEGAGSAAELRANGRPTLFAQAGIHSGEIDGKDAGLMLLRDMTVRGSKTGLLDNATLASSQYEGHVRVAQPTPNIEKRSVALPAGSVRVPTDQPLGDLAVVLLEPTSPDSFYQWGFFLEVLARTEYAEAYVMEPLAQKMLTADPQLRRQFEQRLMDDDDFKNSPRKRLDFFYQRTPYFDDHYLLYPIAREMAQR